LNLKSRPQVIFAANDMMAIGCYDYIKQMNMHIPIDVGIVGFDDVFVSQYLNPPLTTVRVNIEEVGKMAAELLLKKIQSNNGVESSVINIPTELVMRESC
jgi:DNA-binding LacI/PurR family transcriptional regulator